jgi:hypothetical protein
VEGVSVRATAEGNEEGAEVVEEESAELHPCHIDVVSDDPGGGEET